MAAALTPEPEEVISGLTKRVQQEHRCVQDNKKLSVGTLQSSNRALQRGSLSVLHSKCRNVNGAAFRKGCLQVKTIIYIKKGIFFINEV